jgi:hypothetical protein
LGRGLREDCKTVYSGSIPGVASIEDKPASAPFLHVLGYSILSARASPILSLKLRQQYLLFSVQLYQIRNMYRRPTALQNTRNFNVARHLCEGCDTPPAITAIIDQMCVILATVSSERL